MKLNATFTSHYQIHLGSAMIPFTLFLLLKSLHLLVDSSQIQDIGVPGTKVSSRSFQAESCDSARQSVCSACDEFSLCVGGSSIGTITCGTSAPFCSAGESEASCARTPMVGCGGLSAEPLSITCPSVGILPDPYFCRYYHVCLTIGQPSGLYQCPPGYYFSLTVLACRDKRATPCVTAVCNVTNGFVLFGSSRQYYVYCGVGSDGITVQPYIFKCPNRATFNLETQSCVYSCLGVGNYANSNDPSTFFQCYVTSYGRVVATLKRCPEGSFDPALKYCA